MLEEKKDGTSGLWVDGGRFKMACSIGTIKSKRVKLQKSDWWIEVGCGRAYIYSREDSKDPWAIIDEKGIN